ncbi:hypothetical protein HCH_03927 [Hahella chejuensis KCTC 2396]|uniref:Uncharacterized protein n=1 Tax=Hahella chejuensis (strain KCTC 2396) TaxID=349521 RepID=Q2SFC6_HAHCH|nr:hypothetical protein HCH_03927 [Hahella chejuensis KCTC 2396]
MRLFSSAADAIWKIRRNSDTDLFLSTGARTRQRVV